VGNRTLKVKNTTTRTVTRNAETGPEPTVLSITELLSTELSLLALFIATMRTVRVLLPYYAGSKETEVTFQEALSLSPISNVRDKGYSFIMAFTVWSAQIRHSH
jgi:hypothetical protein